MNKSRLSINQYEEGILNANRIVLSQAITLVESNKTEDQHLAAELVDRIISKTGHSIRIGITGVPGVGKSTFIEAFGKHIISLQKKVAVLTIDPSSQQTKGSILGDKTRMEDLAKNPLAFIRPSASGSILGGITGKTREAILLCEAAGYEIIMVETVGVGQSEIAVKNITDFFLLLMLAGAGDELQGIKKGIMEMADAIAITKADGDNVKHASEAQAEYQHALHLISPSNSEWNTKVLTCSAKNGIGIDEIWRMIAHYKNKMQASGHFDSNRKQQNISWMNEVLDHMLRKDFQNNKSLKENLKKKEQEVSDQKISPYAAAEQLIEAYRQSVGSKS